MSSDSPVTIFIHPAGLSAGTFDKDKTSQLRDQLRSEAGSIGKRFQGTLVGYLGEGIILSFQGFKEAMDAVTALIQLENSLQVGLKCGASEGMLAVTEDGIFGDALANAAGFAYAAQVNSAIVTEAAYESLKDSEYKFKPIPELTLRHQKRPIEVFELVVPGIQSGEETASVGRNLAVLPFVNLSADLDLEFFSDGISREIITSLSKLIGPKVIAPGSSFALKKRNLSPVETGRLLNVGAVVSGSVRRAGNQLRIGVSFVSTSDGFELWSGTFEGRVNECFELLEQAIRRIANLAQYQVLSQDQFPRTDIFGTRNIRSFDFYQRACSYLANHSADDALKAISFFERAYDEDMNNDRALSGMASASSLVASFAFRNPSEYYENALRYAHEALEINANNEEAHIVLAYVSFYYRWDWEQGLMEINRALRIREWSPEAHIAKAIYYLTKGIFKEARKELNQALEIDPGSLTIKRLIADSFYHEGEYPKALKHYDELIRQNPGFQRAVEYKGWTLMMSGELADAIELFKALDNEMTLAIKSYTQLGYAYAQKGDRERAVKYLAQVERSEKRNRQVPHQLDLAILYVGLGDLEKALTYLEGCVEEKIGAMIFLKINPVWTPLRSLPGFKSLLKRVGLG